MSIDSILQTLETEKRDERKAKFASYRKLIEASLDGEVSAGDRAQFSALCAELDLTPATIREHADALTKHRRLVAAEEKAAECERELANIKPHLDEWAERKAKIISDLDAEAAPMLARSKILNAQLMDLAWQRASPLEQVEQHPELFGFDRKQTQIVEKSPAQLAAEQADMADLSTAQSFSGMLRDHYDPVFAFKAIKPEYKVLLRRYVASGRISLAPNIVELLNAPEPEVARNKRGQFFAAEAAN